MGRRGIILLVAGLLGLTILSIVHMATGAYAIPGEEILDLLLKGPADGNNDPKATILWSLRLPRLLTAVIVGSGLAIAGAALQGLFRNPLADPYVLGIASGGAFGAATALWLVGQVVIAPSVGAFVGALLAGTIVLLVARRHGGFDLYSVLLAGVAVGLLFSAFLSFVLVLSEHQSGDILAWLLGNVGHTNWSQLQLMAAIFAAGTLPIFWYGRALDTILLGEDTANGLGVNVQRIKIVILVATSLLVACAVAYCGVIGFVGLVVPHSIRLLMGPGHRWLLPLSALGGAILLVAADLGARNVLGDREVPVGIMTALVGGPFFLYLLARGRDHA